MPARKNPAAVAPRPVPVANVHSVRERELAHALKHAVECLEERGGNAEWHRNVLVDALYPHEKVLADEAGVFDDEVIDRATIEEFEKEEVR